MGLHFSKEEFISRKSKVLKSMKDQNIDALLMFRQESMYCSFIDLKTFDFLDVNSSFEK